MPDAWPPSLPQKPTTQGFEEQLADSRIRTQMEAGPPKVRRRFTADITNYKMNFRMTSAQIDTFIAFYDGTLKGGVLTFTLPHPRDSSTTMTLRFEDRPLYSSEDNDNYLLRCKFEEMP